MPLDLPNSSPVPLAPPTCMAWGKGVWGILWFLGHVVSPDNKPNLDVSTSGRQAVITTLRDRNQVISVMTLTLPTYPSI